MNSKHQEDLSHIRSMMEQSSRFISLSGLSGVFAGTFAIMGGLYTFWVFNKNGIDYLDGTKKTYSQEIILHLVIIATFILILSLSFGVFFTIRKSIKYNLPIWTNATKKMLLSLSIPLLSGGIFCLVLLQHQFFVLIAPTTLVFYGLALLNAEKYTLSDVKYLGYSETILGCISLFLLGYGLIFWIIGFGILHILYGLIMYKKYK